jgi:hypothetical protein
LTSVRARYAIAAVLTVSWLIFFGQVSDGWGSLLQLAGVTVGVVIFGVIAWPEDFGRQPRAKRNGPPEA